MLKNYSVGEIKSLISKGFDLELISFELDIPLQELQQIQSIQKTVPQPQPDSAPQPMQKSTNLRTAQEVINQRNMLFASKMQKMRKAYEYLYDANAEQDNLKRSELSPEQKVLVETTISFVSSTLSQIENKSKSNKIESIKSILVELQKIKDFPLNYEQAQQLHDLLQSPHLNGLTPRGNSSLEHLIARTRKIFGRTFLNAINVQVDQSEDIEELKKLSAQITSQMIKDNSVLADSFKSAITRKITKLQQQLAMDKIRNNVSPHIQQLLANLAAGTIDLEKASEIINAESIQRLEKSPKSKFSLTEAQHRQQILIQIKTILMERNEDYKIVDPQKTIADLSQLCDGDLNSAIRTVIGNMIRSQKFDESKKVCNSFLQQGNPQLSATITRQKSEIRNAEISDYVLRGLHMKGTLENDAAYFRLIEDGLKQANISPAAISLGRNVDGSKAITLADIWPDTAKNKNVQSK